MFLDIDNNGSGGGGGGNHIHYFKCYLKHLHSKHMQPIVVAACCKGHAIDACDQFIDESGLNQVYRFFAITPLIMHVQQFKIRNKKNDH